MTKRVLVVDDIPINCKVLVMHLSKFGFTVDTASNGEQAVSACMRTKYSIVLMDIDMPVMNGIDATKLIRKYENATGRRTPILAISSFDRPQDRQRCIRAGLDGLMEKGLRAEEIMSIMNSYDQEDTASHSITLSENRQAIDKQDMQANLAQLRQRFEWRTDEIVSDFLFAALDLFEDFEAAIADRSSVNVTHVAYSLKGSCSNMGLSTMADLCAEIADEGYKKRWHNVSRKYRRLIDMLRAVQEYAGQTKQVGAIC